MDMDAAFAAFEAEIGSLDVDESKVQSAMSTAAAATASATPTSASSTTTTTTTTTAPPSSAPATSSSAAAAPKSTSFEAAKAIAAARAAAARLKEAQKPKVDYSVAVVSSSGKRSQPNGASSSSTVSSGPSWSTTVVKRSVAGVHQPQYVHGSGALPPHPGMPPARPMVPIPPAGMISARPTITSAYGAPVVDVHAMDSAASASAAATQVLAAARANNTNKGKHLRAAAGQVWEDKTLNEWPDNDFRLFVGDLGNEANDATLAKAFSKYPSFAKAKIIRNKRTNKTKGFGFVSFLDPFEASKALKEMDGKYVGNRPIKLRKSTWKERAFGVQRKKNKIFYKNKHGSKRVKNGGKLAKYGKAPRPKHVP